MRSTLHISLVAVILLVAAGFVRAAGAEAAGSRPNIIFVMVDDLGYGDPGAYGQEKVATPHLDRMAREGARFTRAYAGSTVCAPSRSVLMTGQHTGRTTVRGNFGREGQGGVPGIGGGGALRVPLREEDVTVAEVLCDSGYVTGLVGKWGLGEPETVGHPNRQGFDEFFGFLNQRQAHNHYPEFLWDNAEKYPLAGNAEGGREQYAHHLFTERALDFVERHAGGEAPFFLYLAYTVPHARMEIPDFGPYADEDWPEPLRAYAAMVDLIDRDMGRLMSLLDELGIDENTIVFFTSDNGPHAEGGNDPVFFNSNGPLRGMKRDMTEGGIRVPMLVRWPGRAPAGHESDVPWYFADVLPTLAELAGAEPPDEIDGVSVLPVMLGEEQALRRNFLYWEFHERGFDQAAVCGKWKAIRNGADAPLQLYNLEDDIAEEHDVAEEYPEMIRVFEAYLETARTPSANWPTPLD